MDSLIKCDRCGAVLAEVPERSLVHAICANCHFKYQIIHGRVAENASQAVARQHPWTHRSHVYREYELQLDLVREREIVRFSIHERDTPLPAREGDGVVVVHSMRGRELEELLYVQNVTTNDVLRIGHPGARANRSATRAAMLVFVLLFVAAVAVGEERQALFLTLFASSVILSSLAWRWIHERMLPTHALPADVEESRRMTQRLLERKDMCLSRLTLVEQSLSQNEARRARLRSLGTKMLDVGLDIYKPRFAAIDRGLATLDRQKAIDVSLRDGYLLALKMIEIELETGEATDQLEVDVAPVLLQKLDELKELEERQADLVRELQANIEVEQLLRGQAAAEREPGS
jgi:hypothetical protein